VLVLQKPNDRPVAPLAMMRCAPALVALRRVKRPGYLFWGGGAGGLHLQYNSWLGVDVAMSFLEVCHPHSVMILRSRKCTPASICLLL